MSDNQKEWTPSLPLCADATDEQIIDRIEHRFQHDAGWRGAGLLVAREFAKACVEASQSAPLASGMGSPCMFCDKPSEYVVQSRRRVLTCAEHFAMAKDWAWVPESPSPPSAGQEHA